MKQFSQNHSSFFKAALLACAVSALAACGSQMTDDPIRHDPRLQNPIQVAREQVSVTIALPEYGTALSPDDQRRMRAFIRDFVGRGRGSVMVESFLGERAREVLEAQGLRANEIVIAPDATIKAPNAVMSFTANVVQVPTCG
ncbi:MAG TPA: CpaD family pilus assembly lipoprotein, partial [Magnetovibrio sp.]